MLIFIQHHPLTFLTFLRFVPTVPALCCSAGLLTGREPITPFGSCRYRSVGKLPVSCNTILRSNCWWRWVPVFRFRLCGFELRALLHLLQCFWASDTLPWVSFSKDKCFCWGTPLSIWVDHTLWGFVWVISLSPSNIHFLVKRRIGYLSLKKGSFWKGQRVWYRCSIWNLKK